MYKTGSRVSKRPRGAAVGAVVFAGAFVMGGCAANVSEEAASQEQAVNLGSTLYQFGLLWGGPDGPDWLTSPNGRFTFVMQTDCNFPHYDNGTSTGWHTFSWYGGPKNINPADDGKCYTTMQSDGNLVTYVHHKTCAWSGENWDCAGPEADFWKVAWASGTYGNPGARLVVQDDGNAVVYASNGVTPLWSKWYGRAY
jgi:hypothetical protein